MKIILTFLLVLFCIYSGYSQNGYPEPAKTAARLFYIQHSNNINTVVYDANIKGGIINSSQPVNVYRIVYTQNGIIKPLSWIENNFGYGVILIESKPDLFKLRLASRKEIYFYLKCDEYEEARIYVTVNEQKMFLDKMFIQVKNRTSGILVKAEYVLFYGEDYNSGNAVIEKVAVK
jgi:hypothetical protein